MRKLVLIGLLLLGVVTSSYNEEIPDREDIPVDKDPEIDKSLDGLNSSLDSLNKAFHELE